MSEIKKLLEKVNTRQSEYKSTHPDISDSINVFDILGISHKEVIMCRMLGDLIGNKARHPKAERYLELFLSMVLKCKDLPEGFASKAVVTNEYIIPGTDRRIDLAVYTENYFIPIEVKIYAEDKESQCYDYFHHSESRNKDFGRKTLLYYLTLYGKSPSNESLSKKFGNKTLSLKSENYAAISWKDAIVLWLDAVLNEAEDKEEKALIRQYWEVIKEMTGISEEAKSDEIVKLLTADEETFKTAALIGKYIEAAKSHNAEVFLLEMNKAMKVVAKKFNLESRGKIYPDIDFKFKEAHYLIYDVMKLNKSTNKYSYVEPEPNKRLCFFIEIYCRLDVGFAFYDTKTNLFEKNSLNYKNCAEEYLLTEKAIHTYDNEYIIWDYLCEKDAAPNFSEPNGLAAQLTEADKRDEFISKYINEIRNFLENALNKDKLGIKTE